MSVLLDDPATVDVLGRSGLAQTIFTLVKNAPDDWTIRIGVYGKWGDGKSTVLSLVANLAQREGLPVARFNPSRSHDAVSLAGDLFEAIAQAADQQSIDSDSSPATTLQRLRARASAAPGWGRLFKAATPQHAIMGPLFRLGELASDSIRKRFGIGPEDIARLVSNAWAGKRLFVMVDDVDRTEPALVPQLLLRLRELDVPLTSFIVAVDPDVVSAGLAVVHPGWEDAPEFLEKILQFHYWLETPDDAAIGRLARQQLPLTRLQIPEDVLTDITQDLPRNPRKVKEFFRSLWQLAPVIERHRPSDIEWTLLLFIRLLVAEAPLLAGSLLRSEAFRKKLAAGTFFLKTSDTKQKDKIQSELEEMLTLAAGGTVLTEAKRRRLFELIARIGESPLTSEERIAYWSQISEAPPEMTLKEADTLLTAWSASRSGDNVITLLGQHANVVGISTALAAAALFQQLIVLRQERLSRAADSDGPVELSEELSAAQTILDMLASMVSELRVFSDSSSAFDVTELRALYQHFSGWAHFTNLPEYQEARRKEADLLSLAARDSSRIAADMLNALKIMEYVPAGLGPVEQHELRTAFINTLLPFVIADVQARFERPEGLRGLGGAPGLTTHRYLLMSPSAGVYTEAFLEQLKALVGRARKELLIQKNFIYLIQAFASSYTVGPMPTEGEAMNRLQLAATFVPIVWAGAVAARLQPRTAGSLRESRDKLMERLGSFGAELPLPSWFEQEPQRANAEQVAAP